MFSSRQANRPTFKNQYTKDYKKCAGYWENVLEEVTLIQVLKDGCALLKRSETDNSYARSQDGVRNWGWEKTWL